MLRSTMMQTCSTLGFCLALLCTPHCATKDADVAVQPENPDAAQAGVILSAATWSLGWKNEGVEFDAAGGFSLTNDLGYRIHIESGNVVLHRVALVPCPEKPTEAAFVNFTVASAFAHEEESDPSSMEILAMSDVVHPKTMEVGANAFAPSRYCQVYWLVARGMDGAVASNGVDMSNRSIYFSGTWERNGQTGPLLIDTWWPAGTFVDLQSITESAKYVQAAAEERVHFGWIQIDIPMGSLFDGIDFATDTDPVIADTVLDNIILTAEPKLDLQTP